MNSLTTRQRIVLERWINKRSLSWSTCALLPRFCFSRETKRIIIAKTMGIRSPRPCHAMTSFSLKERSTLQRRIREGSADSFAIFDRDARIADRVSRFSPFAVYSAGAAWTGLVNPRGFNCLAFTAARIAACVAPQIAQPDPALPPPDAPRLR